MRVGFLVVGAQKAGTTALHEFLSVHPEIGMPATKELHWFDDDANFGPGASERGYHARFPARSGLRILGEATPAYAYVPAAVPRIHRYCPAMKLVLILRDPIERAFSHYRMVRDVFHAEPLPFEAAVAAERGRLALSGGDTSRGSAFRRHAYVARGCYAAQLARLLQWFPAEQILLLRCEELQAHHVRTLRAIHEFLGVSPEPIPPPRFVYSQGAEPLPPGARERLLPLVLDDVLELERMTGWDLSAWREP
jgi:hypothetical protein